MDSSKKLFSRIAGCSIGLFAASAIFLAPTVSAEAKNTASTISHDHEGEDEDEKSCGSESGCGGENGCGGEKGCGGE